MFQFDLSLVGVASCRVSLERLDDFNHVELVRQMSNETELTALITKFQTSVTSTYKHRQVASRNNLLVYLIYFIKM